jgi:hypothetical protein
MTIKGQIYNLPAGAPRALAELISDISQRVNFGQTWFGDIEYKVWNAIHNQHNGFRKELAADEIKILLDLEQQAGGWIYDDSTAKKLRRGETGQLQFAPTVEWQTMAQDTNRLARYEG